MDYAFPVPRVPVPKPAASPRPPAARPDHAPADSPFMNNMEEISYWVTTKQAPCLFNYDNVIKRRCEEAHCSNISKPKSVHSMVLETSPKKKKKRKLSLLDSESGSTSKHQNVYFETSQNKNRQTMLSSCKSDTLGSDLDFNIKSPSMRNKSKKAKLNKSNRTTVHKKNKVVTSTPKVVGNLRRSLRKAQRNSNNNSHINDSFEVFNCEIFDSNNTKYSNIVSSKERSPSKCKKGATLAGGDQGTNSQNCNKTSMKKPVNLNNGQFDDMSDVSGFTANYIRSTKLHSSKKTRNNVRRKGSRNFMKESPQFSKKDDNTMIICLNKSVNTGMPKTPLMNCSTDSSNVLNLVTLKTNDRSTRISRSTSLLKFMDTRNGNKNACNNIDEKRLSSNNVNLTFNSKSSISSRYPRRHKNNSMEDVSPIKYEKKCPQATDKRLKIAKNSNELQNSDRKENPVDKLVSRTRSGKCIGLMLRQPDNSVLVLSNTMEQVSSLASINVATPSNDRTRSRSKRRSCTSSKQKKQEESEQRESLRDKSGFAACFSDSDEDNGPIKHKKFFC